ncbi:MAG: HIRAN domain-containing protein [Streptosporangiaceae bacterium]
MRNFLLRKSVRDELERRGMAYGEYAAERNALRLQAREEKAGERREAVDAQRLREREEQGNRADEQGRAAAEVREPPDSGPATWLQAPAINIGAQVDVVGEQHHQDALEALAAGRNAFGTRRRLLTAALVREPDNEYDPNAVRVEAAGATVGHLSRDDAPRFHAIIDRLARAGMPATCRAMLTGGWDRGGTDRGFIGIKIFTGRRPASWNGRAAFLPVVPWHEDHIVESHRSGTGFDGLARKPVVTLADTQAGVVSVSIGTVTLGRILGRPGIAAYVACVRAAGLPATAQAQATDGQLVVTVTDPAAVTAALDKLGGGELAAIRRRLPPTGRWICQRCHRIWSDPRQPPPRWYDIEDEDCGSPHICPGCRSYRFTHPL